MSGHSKWSTIKRKKELQDGRRGRIFGKLSRDITVAVKEGGSADPKVNPRLRLSVQNAQGLNMPKDNIEKAINKALRAEDKGYQPALYEGRGPGGVAIYVECLTDNLNRTVSTVRHLFTKHGGELTKSGSLAFLFERKGRFILNKQQEPTEEALLTLIEAGAEDIDHHGERTIIWCAFDDFGRLQKQVDRMALRIENAALQRLAKTPITPTKEDEQRMWRLLDALEEDEDVQAVFHNMLTHAKAS